VPRNVRSDVGVAEGGGAVPAFGGAWRENAPYLTIVLGIARPSAYPGRVLKKVRNSSAGLPQTMQRRGARHCHGVP